MTRNEFIAAAVRDRAKMQRQPLPRGVMAEAFVGDAVALADEMERRCSAPWAKTDRCPKCDVDLRGFLLADRPWSEWLRVAELIEARATLPQMPLDESLRILLGMPKPFDGAG